jgi:gas vesicle protein
MRSAKRGIGLVSAGIAVGIAAGLMLAPKSGREIRSQIKESADATRTRGSRVRNWLRRGGKTGDIVDSEIRPVGSSRD